MLGLAGDSASGKTTLAEGIEWILGPDRVTRVCIDDYHRFDRRSRAGMDLTALQPSSHYMDIAEEHVRQLALGDPILKPVYDHVSGTFRPAEYVEPKDVVIVEGLLSLHTQAIRDCLDVKVFLEPEEELRHRWKINRDCNERGYAIEDVVAELRRRELDAARFVRPQRAQADIVVTFHRQVRLDAYAHLSARLVLRPTLPHPELKSLVSSFRRDRIGLFADETGLEQRSAALAFTQLLIVYHVAGALRGSVGP